MWKRKKTRQMAAVINDKLFPIVTFDAVLPRIVRDKYSNLVTFRANPAKLRMIVKGAMALSIGKVVIL